MDAVDVAAVRRRAPRSAPSFNGIGRTSRAAAWRRRRDGTPVRTR